MQGRIKVLKDIDKSNILPMTHAKAVYVDEETTLDKTLNNIESHMEQQRKTYAELKELVENNRLIPGVQYVLTDYRTKYIQPTTNVLKEMDVEELVLTANSENTFEPIVSSLKYPGDVVYYDFNNNICEDKATPRKGFILRRYDPISKNDAPQDWRTMLWARYKPNQTHYYHAVHNGGIAYKEWTSGSAQLNYLYKADNKLWLAKNTNVPTSSTDPNVFYEVYLDLDTPLLINEKTRIGKDIELIRGDLVEVKTFGDGCVHNVIEGSHKKELHNNVFINNSYGNILDNTCTGNAFYDSYRNKFGVLCFENIFITSHSNKFGNGCYRNFFGASCRYNSFGNSCYNNSFGNNCFNNSFGNDCYGNSFSFNSRGNSLGNECNNNSTEEALQSNTFGNGCRNNSFGRSCYGNSFGDYVYNCVFGFNCIHNFFGGHNINNTFGAYCSRNTFGNDNENNKFGDRCADNTFFNNCDDNIFGDNFQFNMVKRLKSKNVTGLSEMIKATVTTTFETTNNSQVFWYINTTTNGMMVKEIP